MEAPRAATKRAMTAIGSVGTGAPVAPDLLNRVSRSLFLFPSLAAHFPTFPRDSAIPLGSLEAHTADQKSSFYYCL